MILCLFNFSTYFEFESYHRIRLNIHTKRITQIFQSISFILIIDYRTRYYPFESVKNALWQTRKLTTVKPDYLLHAFLNFKINPFGSKFPDPFIRWKTRLFKDHLLIRNLVSSQFSFFSFLKRERRNIQNLFFDERKKNIRIHSSKKINLLTFASGLYLWGSSPTTLGNLLVPKLNIAFDALFMNMMHKKSRFTLLLYIDIYF